MKFTKGTRVRCNVSQGQLKRDYLGTCLETRPLNDEYVDVVWDENIKGHDHEGRCKDGHGWTVRIEDIELAELIEDSEGNLW